MSLSATNIENTSVIYYGWKNTMYSTWPIGYPHNQDFFSHRHHHYHQLHVSLPPIINYVYHHELMAQSVVEGINTLHSPSSLSLSLNILYLQIQRVFCIMPIIITPTSRARPNNCSFLKKGQTHIYPSHACNMLYYTSIFIKYINWWNLYFDEFDRKNSIYLFKNLKGDGDNLVSYHDWEIDVKSVTIVCIGIQYASYTDSNCDYYRRKK